MMIRKILTALLCLALALALPLASLAATETTLTIAPGAELSSVPAFKDLLDALSFVLVDDCDSMSGSFTLRLGGQDALTIAGRTDDKALYVHNSILGEKTLCLPWEDVAKLLSTMAASSDLDQSTLTHVGDSAQAVLKPFQAFSSLSAKELEGLTFEQKTEKLKEIFADDAGMVAYLDGFQKSMKTTDGDFTSDKHDPATQKWEYTLTSADFIRLLESDYAKNVIESTLKVIGSSESAESVIKQVRDVYEKMEITAPVTMYTADEGKTLVGYEYAFTVKGETTDSDGETTTIDVAVSLNYARLTKDGETNHLVTAALASEGETTGDLRLSVTETADAGKRGTFGILADGSELNFLFQSYNSAADSGTKVRELAVYYREDAEALEEPAADAAAMISFKLESKDVDAGALAEVAGATEESSLKVLSQTEEEQQTYLSGLLTRAQQALYSIVALLPESVMQLLNSTMN